MKEHCISRQPVGPLASRPVHVLHRLVIEDRTLEETGLAVADGTDGHAVVTPHTGSKDPFDTLFLDPLADLGETDVAHLDTGSDHLLHHLVPPPVSLCRSQAQLLGQLVGQADRDASAQVRAEELERDVGPLDVRLLAHLAGVAESISVLRRQFAALGSRQQRGHVQPTISPHRAVDGYVVGAQAVYADGHQILCAGLLKFDQLHQCPQFARTQHHPDAPPGLADGDVARHARRVQPHYRSQRVRRLQ